MEPYPHNADAPIAADRNPYASPSVLDEPVLPADAFAPGGEVETEISLGYCIFRWSMVCIFAAAPSFVIGFGMTDGRFTGMLLGVACFIALYVWTDRRTKGHPWRQSRPVRTTLRTVFVLRMLATVIYPIGAIADMVCGMLSVTIVFGAIQIFDDANSRDGMGVVTSFFVTLVQGCVLNLVLLLASLIVYPVVSWFQRRSTA